MKRYMFNTVATMKDYNRKNWYINADIISDMYILAETVEEALKEYKKQVSEKYYIEISSNALKHKSPMYISDRNGNSMQVGYVITGKTEFQRENYTWTSQYIDLWVNIKTIVATEF